MTEVEFTALMHRIVGAVMPDELAAFELGAEWVVADLFKLGGIGKRKSTRGEYELIPDGAAQDVLAFVALLTESFAAVRDIEGDNADISSVKNAWHDRLLHAGLDVDLASRVVESFTADLLQLARGTRK